MQRPSRRRLPALGTEHQSELIAFYMWSLAVVSELRETSRFTAYWFTATEMENPAIFTPTVQVVLDLMMNSSPQGHTAASKLIVR